MYCEIKTITPEIAREYLLSNRNNYRPISGTRVEAYAKDMKLGKWELNGEAIKFNKSGELVDGQHRLAAIAKSGVPVTMLVVHDVSDDVKIYDVQQARTIAQIARASGLDGCVSSSGVMAAATILCSVDWRSQRVPKGHVVDYVMKHSDDFATAHEISRRGASTGIGRKGACIAAVYCMIRLGKQKEMLYDFFEVVNSGFSIGGRDCSPAIVLRNYLLSVAPERMNGANRAKTQFAITVQAVNDFEKHLPRKKVYKPDYDLADTIKLSVAGLDANLFTNGIV